MTNDNFVEQLDKQLQDIETFAREYDEGSTDAAIKIAASLREIFHHTGQSTSLLAHLRGRFIRLLTSVEKPPYPQDSYLPMAEIEGKFEFPVIHVGAQPVTVVEPSEVSTDAGEKETDQASSGPRLVGERAGDHRERKESDEKSDRPLGIRCRRPGNQGARGVRRGIEADGLRSAQELGPTETRRQVSLDRCTGSRPVLSTLSPRA